MDEKVIKAWSDRLGCAAKIVGEPLATADYRKPKNNPHLKKSIELLHHVFDYLDEKNIRFFRLSSDMIPYATHPKYPELNWQKQLKESKKELVELGEKAKSKNLRLSFHPSQFILLSSSDKKLIKSSVEELRWQAEVLDLMGQTLEARVFLHGGGAYGDYDETSKRLIENINKLPSDIKRRFALENDDTIWNANRILKICKACEIPMVFDLHHHGCNSEGEAWQDALGKALKTWGSIRPKIHISTPKSDSLEVKSWRKPKYKQHADFIDPFTVAKLIYFCEEKDLPEFDIMLEAKAKDVAVLKLRQDLLKVDYQKVKAFI